MKIMEYMVFVIYVIVVAQFIDSSVENTERTPKGRTFYKYSAISNMVIGFAGMLAVNGLLRDKGIIPQQFVWIALIGFILQVVYAMYCLYKAVVSNEP